MSRRKILIGASIAGHAALFAGVFVSSVWTVDQVDHRSRSRASLAVIAPPLPENGSFSLPKQELQRKAPPKVAVKETRQPRKPELEITIDKGGSETGTGEGKGKGPGDGPEAGDPCREPGSCEPVAVPPPLPELPKPPPPPPIHNVTPQILKGLRLSGVTVIHPPREVFDQMYRGGDLQTSAAIKLCLSIDGSVSSIDLKKSTKYGAYDDVIVAAVRGWRYKPYTVNGRPVPACGMVTFVYQMK